MACVPRLKLSSLLASGLPHSPFPASARGAPCVLDCIGGCRAGAAPHGQHRAGVLRCPGLPLFLSDGQACLGSGGRSPALACGSRAGALLFLAGVSLRTRHLLLVSGGLSRPRRPVSLVTQQCPCCCFLGALIVCVRTLKMFAFFVSSQICVIFPVVSLLSNINCSHLLVILQFHFLALRVTWKIVSFLNTFLKY